MNNDMNNDMNLENQQGMDNVPNSAFPQQPVEPTPVVPEQPVEAIPVEPTPVVPQQPENSVPGTIPESQPVPQAGAPTNAPATNKGNNKIVFIILAVIGAFVVLLIIIGVIGKLAGGSSTKYAKVLKCTTHHASVGVYGDETWEYYINDGTASIKYTKVIDLENSRFDGDVDTWVKEQVKEAQKECEAAAGCKFEYKYSKGKSLTSIRYLSEEFVGDTLKGMTAEEIYNNQKERHESGAVDGNPYTCE